MMLMFFYCFTYQIYLHDNLIMKKSSNTSFCRVGREET